jgi:hypothetical protein
LHRNCFLKYVVKGKTGERMGWEDEDEDIISYWMNGRQ